MLRCQECGTANDFELGDGTGYCRVCGTQSQDIREEVVELDDTLFTQHNASVRRVAKGLNSTKTTGIPDRIWTVTEAVQAILLIQTNGLISQGIPEQLTNVVGNLWFRFLAKIGTINVPKVEPVVLTDIYKISIFDNLAILYLSLLSIHYPVLCCDILSWIGDGTLCYFNTIRLLPDAQ
ncbi:TATA box-binding protein-associated factor RNA polymerase I subunit B-like isoform X1 [Bolinopsis microptera]|uniref:TATA box-binding protein-associated factor RNA polymerase I subunit B-like isoform X1 n=1 Tax=Bolinopsis microptera TaxID=2820187 RepID=UPI00307A3AF8